MTYGNYETLKLLLSLLFAELDRVRKFCFNHPMYNVKHTLLERGQLFFYYF